MRAMVSSERLAGSAPGSGPNAAHTVPTQVSGGRLNAAAYWVNLNGACARASGLRPTIRASEGLSAFMALDATGEAAYDGGFNRSRSAAFWNPCLQRRVLAGIEQRAGSSGSPLPVDAVRRHLRSSGKSLARGITMRAVEAGACGVDVAIAAIRPIDEARHRIQQRVA
jgi:hypothetical protein